MKEWKIGEVIGYVSATAFALTVVYLYGYQTVSHLDVFEYFSVNDYLRLAVRWLAPVVVLWLAGALFEAALRRSEHGMSEQEIHDRIAKGRHPRFWHAFRKGGVEVPYVAATVVVVLNTALFLFAHLPKLTYYESMSGLAPIAWFTAVKWYEKEKRLVSAWSNVWRMWVLFFPAMLIFSLFRGASTAERAKTPLQSTNATRVSVLGRADPTVGRILFNLDNYLLLRTSKTGEVEAIPQTQVTLIVEGDGK